MTMLLKKNIKVLNNMNYIQPEVTNRYVRGLVLGLIESKGIILPTLL